MDPYNNWDADGIAVKAVPMPHEDFEQYFTQYNEIDNLFNETLTGLQDLDVPSGFVTHDIKQHQSTLSHPRTPKHGRQASGTAIFGFSDHNRELSIGGLATDLYKPTKGLVEYEKAFLPGELSNAVNANMEFNFVNPVDIPGRIHLDEEEEYQDTEEPKVAEKENKSDYIVTNQNPKSYKFPPSSPPAPPPANANFQNVNSYSAKYLKDLGKMNSNKQQPETAYVDDIEPLLERDMYQSFTGNMSKQLTPFHASTVTGAAAAPNTVYKYVPVPVQDSAAFQQSFIKNGGVYLPPPSPPTLSNGSPEYQSLPEPQSPSPSRSSLNQGFYSATRTVNPAAAHQASSPIQNNKANFYNPQFFSDQPGNPFSSGETLAFHQLLPVHPSSSISSSPVKYYNSPLRNLQPTNDDTVDANATITQLTPLKNQLPTTPSRSKIRLEWSPIISPNAKANRDVKAAIQNSSPRRRIKKISLLPPGELDQYWDGPDEDKNFVCTFNDCGKKFTRRYNVRSHIQTHLSDRPFSCSYCPKKFVRQHDLNRHVKGHLEARHCRCPCGKEFVRLDAMRKHRARNICSGGFASTEEHGISKPHRKSRNEVLDEFTSDRLSEDLGTSMEENLLGSL